MIIYQLTATDGFSVLNYGYYTTKEIADAWKKHWELESEKDKGDIYTTFYINECELKSIMPIN